MWHLDCGSSDDVRARRWLRWLYHRLRNEQALVESQGPAAVVAAFFCGSDSVVVLVVVGRVGASAISWWQTVFAFAVIVRHSHHVENWCGRK